MSIELDGVRRYTPRPDLFDRATLMETEVNGSYVKAFRAAQIIRKHRKEIDRPTNLVARFEHQVREGK